MKIKSFFVGLFLVSKIWAQPNESQEVDINASSRFVPGSFFVSGIKNPATQVKDQERTSTCWSFSTTSLLESQSLKNKTGILDLSEMYTVRCIYLEKATNYILRQGHAQFSEGALGHDVIRSVASNGIVPESVYSGHVGGSRVYDHEEMFKALRKYLDSTIKTKGGILVADWKPGYNQILDKYMGVMPTSFNYNGKVYTPKSFSASILRFNPDDYINLTSFTHHPYYQPFVLEVPDNFSNGMYYNIPLKEMTELVKQSLINGYTVLWDADVSNSGFNAKQGLAMNLSSGQELKPESKEEKTDAVVRQTAFENLATQDDHLMHIVGLEKSKDGKVFFVVKNSWGDTGPFGGYIHVSESYFEMNTISLVLPKAAMSQTMADKLKK